MYLLYFIVISFWKRMWPFILTKLNPLHPKMLSIKFCWNWLSGFINFILVFSLIHYYLLLEKVMALHLNKLESPSPKDALYQVWLKLAMWFWRRRQKCEKFTTTMKTTDNGQSELKIWLIKGGSKTGAPCGSPLLKKILSWVVFANVDSLIRLYFNCIQHAVWTACILISQLTTKTKSICEWAWIQSPDPKNSRILQPWDRPAPRFWNSWIRHCLYMLHVNMLHVNITVLHMNMLHFDIYLSCRVQRYCTCMSP